MLHPAPQIKIVRATVFPLLYHDLFYFQLNQLFNHSFLFSQINTWLMQQIQPHLRFFLQLLDIFETTELIQQLIN